MPKIIREEIDRLWFEDDDSKDEIDLFMLNDMHLEIEIESFEDDAFALIRQAKAKLNTESTKKLYEFLHSFFKGEG